VVVVERNFLAEQPARPAGRNYRLVRRAGKTTLPQGNNVFAFLQQDVELAPGARLYFTVVERAYVCGPILREADAATFDASSRRREIKESEPLWFVALPRDEKTGKVRAFRRRALASAGGCFVLAPVVRGSAPFSKPRTYPTSGTTWRAPSSFGERPRLQPPKRACAKCIAAPEGRRFAWRMRKSALSRTHGSKCVKPPTSHAGRLFALCRFVKGDLLDTYPYGLFAVPMSDVSGSKPPAHDGQASLSLQRRRHGGLNR
jgi:hypothetical protein